MSNIQKLYEIAGVEDIGEVESCSLEDFKNCEYFWKFDCLKCEKAKKILPPFTAEKQLELIKWFVKTFAEIETLEINYFLNDCFQISSCNSVSKFEFGFEEALASFIFNLYLDLTDDQKEEIKRILQ